jgi:hypothetical protein
MEDNINKYFNLIVEDKPSFIKTKNSYERSCLYKALEKYGKEKEQIWFNRKKEYIDVFCSGFMCKRHKCELSRCDDYEGDYWCDECYNWKHFLYILGKRDIESVSADCMDLGEKGDFLYKSKVTIGLNIYYINPNLNKIKSTLEII